MAEALTTSRTVNIWVFLKNRKLSVLALIATLVVLILSLIQPQEQLSWLYRDNGIVIQHLQIIYLLLIPPLLIVVIFEPQIHRELLEAHALGALALLSIVICFLLSRLMKPDEAWRFLRSAGFLWFVIVHVLFLCALTLLLALDSPAAPVSVRTRRYAFGVVVLVGLAAAVLQVLSVGNFMGLDLTDEVWFGSLAVNYAERGAFYSSYVVGAFGNPDPFLPRYYLITAEWLRLFQTTSFFSLRAFALFAASLGVALTAFILWRTRNLTGLQRVVGLVVMIGLSAFVRTSHNIRMDAGLAFYGALLLLGLLGYFEDGRKRWLILCGAALIIGIEMIPPLAVVMNGVIGLMLIAQVFARRASWRHVLIYGVVCTLAVGAYLAIHFLPDVATNVTNYLNYTKVYYSGSLGFDFARVLQFGRISAFLSPVELIVVIAVMVLGARNDQRLLLVFAVTALLVMAIRSASYGYLMVFTPFVAYFAARVFRSQAVVTLGAFLLIPSLLSVPIYDTATAIDFHSNQREIDEADLLTWRVPPGSTVLAEEIFWITLHDEVNFMGRPGPALIARLQNKTPLEAAKALGVDVVICNQDDTAMCDIGAQLFGEPYEFNVTNAHYLMYSALGSK
ncbi:MAG: hypothetical protein ABI700_01675 [Chloroflexota bacterium]